MAARRTTKKKVKRAEVARKSQFPAHLQVDTPEEWRGLKRTEWREVRQALERYYHGSAFVPAQSPLHKIGTLARQISDALEAPDWIAW